MNKENAIEVRNMSKHFKVEYDKANTLKTKMIFWKHKPAEYHQVLKNINLDIKKGETVALIGTNGSGKSTLLKLMTKIIYPNEGTIETQGKLTSLLELGAGFHPDFTGRENIYFNAAIFGLTHAEIDKRVDDIIEFSELGEFIDNPIRTYSSGMYMRLAFSVAINVDAEILLIDEILAVGDQHFQDKCFAKLQELRRSDKTIVIVSHSLDSVKRLCNRAIWIYKGHFQLDGEPEYVIDEYLKQVALDHQKSVVAGEEKGHLWIDSPIDLYRYKKSESILLRGWQIATSFSAKLNVKVDGKPIDVKRVERQDVFNMFVEDYGGFMDPKKLGYEFTIEANQLSEGMHKCLIECVLPDGKVLAEKEHMFFIE